MKGDREGLGRLEKEKEREGRGVQNSPRLLWKVCPVQYRLNSLIKRHTTACVSCISYNTPMKDVVDL